MEAEKDRMKNPLSTAGFASTIIIGGLGDTSKAKVSNVALNGITLGL